MRHAPAALCLLVLTAALLAAPWARATQTPSPTRVEADQDSGAINFFVKGQLVAVLGEGGLRVRDYISYDPSLKQDGVKPLLPPHTAREKQDDAP